MCIRLILLLMTFVGVLVCSAGVGRCGESRACEIRFGTLPVLQALPLFVARDKGLFAKEKLNVELVPFNTASERDIALTARTVDGNIGDLFSAAILRGNGLDIAVVATNYDSRTASRMFAILAKPGSKHSTLKNLAGVPIGISSHSVNHYVTETLMELSGVAQERIETVESKNIGLRLQMLLSGVLEAATLPEPLATAAASKGALVLGDDSGLSVTQTVLLFSNSFLKERPGCVRAFLRAVAEASYLINSDPDSVRKVMVDNCQLPEALADKYPVPRFPNLQVPDRDTVKSATEWLGKQGVLRQETGYEQLVNASFLP
jgi:NitT/TauT family transport system substrate-binding protein